MFKRLLAVCVASWLDPLGDNITDGFVVWELIICTQAVLQVDHLRAHQRIAPLTYEAENVSSSSPGHDWSGLQGSKQFTNAKQLIPKPVMLYQHLLMSFHPFLAHAHANAD